MSTSKSITEIVRQLRRNQTEAESILWEGLRNRKLDGFKFLRQHPIVYFEFNEPVHFFIADFYCAEKKLVLELDGKIHDFQKDYDQQRDLIIREKGLKVLRIKNEELKNIERVKEKIRKYL